MTAGSSYVWVLNPDAERELAATHSYAVRAAFIARINERRALFDRLVLGEAAAYSHELTPVAATQRALFWCPTPRIIARARECGLTVGPQPSVEVLRRVHDKRFLTSNLAEFSLPGRCNISSEKEWRHLRASTRGPLRLKRPFGYAGKGQRTWPEIGGEDFRWLADSLRLGGFVAEPHIPEAVEISQHGYVDRRGALLGSACSLTTDTAGAPVSIESATALEASLADQVTRLTTHVAETLISLKYFGPFGVDLLVVDGAPRLIDLNPRFTLGWSIGMGARRAEAIERALSPVPPAV